MRVGKQDQAVIYGIQKNYLYCLRVLGFSTGGDGTMSELVYFTLGKQCLHYNKCELVFCTPVYHKHHLTSNLTNKGGNPLALFTDTCHTKTFDECNNSNTCVYAFMKFKLMLINHYMTFE